MRIRTIIGVTLPEALARVREELGPNAVILNIEDSRNKKGVLVRAAIEHDRTRDPAIASPVCARLLDDTPTSEFLAIEARLESELQTRLRAAPGGAHSTGPIDPKTAIEPALLYHKISPALTEKLVTLAHEATAPTVEQALARAIERAFRFSPLAPRTARPVLLLGHSGHGKTTMIARLAVRAVTAGEVPTLITTDTAKAGAVAQLETYASLLKANFAVADTPEALAKVISEHRNKAAVLIDAPGMNIWNAEDRTSIGELAAAVDAEPVWVSSAECSADDARDVSHLLARLGIKRFIATKLDMARRLGGVLNLLEDGAIALSHTCASPYLAHGLDTPHPLTLATLILQIHIASQSHKLSAPAQSLKEQTQ
jgi:flagellar biosynthesis protein FlhF